MGGSNVDLASVASAAADFTTDAFVPGMTEKGLRGSGLSVEPPMDVLTGNTELPHPEALAAKERARATKELAEAVKAAKLENLQNLIHNFDLKFIDLTPNPFREHPMTIAYSGFKLLRVSTSVMNPVDKYNKMEGRLVAARAFMEGHTIWLRKPALVKPAAFLRDMFSVCNH